jgi:hypothetical protein
VKEPREYLERAAQLLEELSIDPLIVVAESRLAYTQEAQALIALAKEIRETKRTTNDLA